MYCKNCGHRIIDGMEYCIKCHSPIDTDIDPVPSQTDDEKAVSSATSNATRSVATKPVTKILSAVAVLLSLIFAIAGSIEYFRWEETLRVYHNDAAYFAHYFRLNINYDALVILTLASITIPCLLMLLLFLKKGTNPTMSVIPIWLFIVFSSFTLALTPRLSNEYLLILSVSLLPSFVFALTYTITIISKGACKQAYLILLIVLLVLHLAGMIVIMCFTRFESAFTQVFVLIISSCVYTAYLTFYAVPLQKKTKRESRAYAGYAYYQSQNQKFCPSCGIQYSHNKRFCDQCGNALREVAGTAESAQQNRINSMPYPQQNPLDAPSGGFAALGFFFPVIGFILYLVWKDNFPLRARSTGKGALIGFITSVALSIILSVVYIIILKSAFPF